MHDDTMNETPTTNGKPELTSSERQHELDESVRELPDPDPSELTQDDVDALKDAGLEELAELAERRVPAAA